jgi:hypothetical protein
MQSCREPFNTIVNIGAVLVGGLGGAQVGATNIAALTAMGLSPLSALLLGLVLGSGVAYSLSRGIVIMQEIAQRDTRPARPDSPRRAVAVERRELSRRWTSLSRGDWIGLAGVAVGAAALVLPQLQSKEPTVPWQRETLINVLTHGDTRTVTKFVRGGWKLGSDEFFHLLRNESVQSAAMQPIVDGKAVTGFEFCKGYKELAQIVGLPAPMPMPDGSVHFKTLDDAYVQNVEELSRDRVRWTQFVSVYGRRDLRRHYDGLIETERGRVGEQQRTDQLAAPAPSIGECRSALKRKFPLLDLVNNPRLPDERKLARSVDDRFLLQFYTGYDPSRGDWKRWEQVYASAVEWACANQPRPRRATTTQRLERLEAIRAAIP